MNKRPVTYLVWCRGLGYLAEEGTWWTGIVGARRFSTYIAAKCAAFEAAIREPHLIGDIQPDACFVDHWKGSRK